MYLVGMFVHFGILACSLTCFFQLATLSGFLQINIGSLSKNGGVISCRGSKVKQLAVAHGGVVTYPWINLLTGLPVHYQLLGF